MITLSFDIEPGYWTSIPEQTRKPEKVFGEFIDNSIKSWQLYSHADEKCTEYRKSKGIPTNPYAKQQGVKVTIRFFDCVDKSKRRIEVEDNAWGIKGEELQRAFSMSSTPPDKERFGISGEFGKGMKDSGMWLSKRWVVHTKVYGELIERQIELDLAKLSKGEKRDVEEVPKKKEDHYTKIVLNDLNSSQLFTPSKQKRIMNLLSEIYSDFIEAQTLKLNFIFIGLDANGDTIAEPEEKVIEPVGTDKIRIWPKTINIGTSSYPIAEISNPQILYKWYKEILIEMPEYKEDEGSVPWARVRCWVQTSGTRKKAGILLYRDGRVIKGAGDEETDRYKPEALYEKTSGRSYTQLFLCGRVDLVNFKTTYTKDDIRFIDDQEDVLFTKIKEFLESEIDSACDAQWRGENLQSMDKFSFIKTRESAGKVWTYVKEEGSTLGPESTPGSNIEFYKTCPYDMIDHCKNIQGEEKRNAEDDDNKKIGDQIGSPAAASTIINPNPNGLKVEPGDTPKVPFTVTYDNKVFHLLLYKESRPLEQGQEDEYDMIEVADKFEAQEGAVTHITVKIIINTENTFYREYQEDHGEVLDRIAYAYGIAKVKTLMYKDPATYRDEVLEFFNNEFNVVLTKVLAVQPSRETE